MFGTTPKQMATMDDPLPRAPFEHDPAVIYVGTKEDLARRRQLASFRRNPMASCPRNSTILCRRNIGLSLPDEREENDFKPEEIYSKPEESDLERRIRFLLTGKKEKDVAYNVRTSLTASRPLNPHAAVFVPRRKGLNPEAPVFVLQAAQHMLYWGD